jgi:predicted GIY-YIG superfamily endonuclease
MKVTLYIIKGILSGKKYVGITNDLQRRLREHHDGNSKGGQLTARKQFLFTKIFYFFCTTRREIISLNFPCTLPIRSEEDISFYCCNPCRQGRYFL